MGRQGEADIVKSVQYVFCILMRGEYCLKCFDINANIYLCISTQIKNNTVLDTLLCSSTKVFFFFVSFNKSS